MEASLLSEEEYLLLTGRLHRVLRPFMMRRLKETVAKELPGKVRGCSHAHTLLLITVIRLCFQQ